MRYSIGEMAKLLGVATSTLRYYDKEGLLPFVERTEGGIRLFKDEDYQFLKIIECLKATGMQLKDIKVFIKMVQQGDDTIEERLKLFQKQREEVEKQMKALQNTMNIVNYKCWYYEKAKEAGTIAAVENIKEEELPEEIRRIKQTLTK